MMLDDLCLGNKYQLLNMDRQKFGQNNGGRRLCPPLKWNLLFFAGSKKHSKAFMLYLFIWMLYPIY